MEGGSLEDTLTLLKQRLARKQTFESAVASLTHIMATDYASASPSLQKSIYALVSRTATLLQTRYAAIGFWKAGLKLFEVAQQIVTTLEEKDNMKACILRAKKHIAEQNSGEDQQIQSLMENSRFLFEGQLTVGPEPPPPAWLVTQAILTNMITNAHLETGNSSENNRRGTASQDANQMMVDGIAESWQRGSETDTFLHELQQAVEATLQEAGTVPQGTPPASKEEVAKLPVVDVTDDIVKQIGEGTECAVCKEVLVTGNKMQEMPCKHRFHPDCLKPWLDEHNSCPICRFELRTDDHQYESKKERDKELEEERKGAANAVPGGDLMYI